MHHYLQLHCKKCTNFGEKIESKTGTQLLQKKLKVCQKVLPKIFGKNSKWMLKNVNTNLISKGILK